VVSGVRWAIDDAGGHDNGHFEKLNVSYINESPSAVDVKH
jgi:hypothetical protein